MKLDLSKIPPDQMLAIEEQVESYRQFLLRAAVERIEEREAEAKAERHKTSALGGCHGHNRILAVAGTARRAAGALWAGWGARGAGLGVGQGRWWRIGNIVAY
jgi:hypothetical protein